MRHTLAYALVTAFGIVLTASFARLLVDHPVLRKIGLLPHEPNVVFVALELAVGLSVLAFGIAGLIKELQNAGRRVPNPKRGGDQWD